MLPEAFLQRMEAQLGSEYPAFLESLERPRAVALRFNPMKGERPVLPFVGAPVPWEPEGFYYDPETRPGLHVYHEAGVYYLQEASAMAPVALLDPKPGERVCDLCAAPGGKTTQIAGRMLGQGFLVCNEINPKRAKILSRNIERMGVANALVTNEHPETLASRFPGFFDRVLVDAPCSGEGMFRKEEAAVTDWSQETVQMCARRQREILDSAARLVRPSGVFHLHLRPGGGRGNRGGLPGSPSGIHPGAGGGSLVCSRGERQLPDVAPQAAGGGAFCGGTSENPGRIGRGSGLPRGKVPQSLGKLCQRAGHHPA